MKSMFSLAGIAIVVGAFVGLRQPTVEVSGQMQGDDHIASLHIGQGDEKFCVRDYTTDAANAVDEDAIQADFVAWLNESGGWEAADTGSGELTFISVNCKQFGACFPGGDITQPSSNCPANLYIDFINSLPSCDRPSARDPLACAPVRFEINNTTTTAGGHAHPTRVRIVVDGSAYNAASSEVKKGAMMHEMGHVLGVFHEGPAMGVTSSFGFLWSGVPWGEQPSAEERQMVRSHIQNDVPVGLHPCLGWHETDEITVGWWDSAGMTSPNVDWNESRNDARILRSGSTQVVYNKAPKAYIGTRITEMHSLAGEPTSGDWQLRAEVHSTLGGSPGYTASSPLSRATGPHEPCLLRATNGGVTEKFLLRWLDGSHNEVLWEIWAATMDNGVDFPPTRVFTHIRDYDFQAGSTEEEDGYGFVPLYVLPQDVEDLPALGFGDWVCFKVRAKGSGGSFSIFSGISCAPAAVNSGGNWLADDEP